MITSARERSVRPKWLILGIACAIAGGLAGCESGALSPQERSARLPAQADEWATLGYRIEWRGFPTLMPGSEAATIDLLGDGVGVLDTSGVFTLLDARGGTMRWSDQPASPLTRFFGAIRQDNKVYVGSETDTYVYDAATGNLLNRLHTPRVVSTRPVLIGGLLIYGTPSGAIVTVIEANGFGGWTTGVSGAVDADLVRFGSTPLLGVVSGRGEALVFDGTTGSGVGRCRLYGGPGGALATSDTVMYVASLDHSLYAIARDTGQVLWQQRTDAPLRRAPAAHQGRVYADLGREGLCAMDASTGARLWSAPQVHGEVIAVRVGKLVVADGERAMLIEPSKGGVVQSVALRGFSKFKAEKFEDGPLYALSPAGMVTKLAPK